MVDVLTVFGYPLSGIEIWAVLFKERVTSETNKKDHKKHEIAIEKNGKEKKKSCGKQREKRKQKNKKLDKQKDQMSDF
jgi:hypothetical protein